MLIRLIMKRRNVMNMFQIITWYQAIILFALLIHYSSAISHYIGMSCHYSCSSCSGPVYFDLCTACPSSRSLINGICVCQSSFYQVQSAQCSLVSGMSTVQSYTSNVASVVYYVAIGFHLIVIMLAINRIISVRLKKIIDTMQVVGLIAHYRYQYRHVTTKGLNIMNAFNFNYLQQLVCTQQAPPYGCQIFQNLFGILFTLLLFLGLLIAAYAMATCIQCCGQKEDVVVIRDGNQVQGRDGQMISLKTYLKSVLSSVVLIYVDNTAIMTTVAVSRIAVSNNLGILIVIPLLILLVCVGRLHFTTVNDPQQTTLAYRAKNKYFYSYDQNYHYNYIDHMFDQGTQQERLSQVFYPHSNLITLQLIFKVLISASTIVFYKYQPYLFAIVLFVLLIVGLCRMGAFRVYQRCDLLFYLLLTGLQLLCVVSFYLYFFSYIPFLAAALLIVYMFFQIFTTICLWKSDKEGQIFTKTFQLQQKSHKQLQQSEDQLMKDSPNNQEIVEAINNQQEANAQVSQPQGSVRAGPSRVTQRMRNTTNLQSNNVVGSNTNLVQPVPEQNDNRSSAVPLNRMAVKRKIKYDLNEDNQQIDQNSRAYTNSNRGVVTQMGKTNPPLYDNIFEAPSPAQQGRQGGDKVSGRNSNAGQAWRENLSVDSKIKQPSVMGNRDQSVKDDKQQPLANNKQASVVGNKQVSVMGNKQASLLDNNKQQNAGTSQKGRKQKSIKPASRQLQS